MASYSCQLHNFGFVFISCFCWCLDNRFQIIYIRPSDRQTLPILCLPPGDSGAAMCGQQHVRSVQLLQGGEEPGGGAHGCLRPPQTRLECCGMKTVQVSEPWQVWKYNTAVNPRPGEV